MSLTAKRLLFASACLIVWFGFVFHGGVAANVVIAGLGGWYMGGLIYSFTNKVFPNEREEQV